MRISILSFCLLIVSFFSHAQTGYIQEGKASFYADKFEGRTTASGERYSHNKKTCAHLSLPFGTLVRVTNLANSKSVVVRVNDRGPFVPNRIIDLSKSAAQSLDFIGAGIADVKIEVIEEDGKYIADKPAENVQQPRPKQQESQVAAKVDREPEKRPVVQAQAPASKPQPMHSEPSVSELYEVSVKRLNPQGYAVQIGSYKELVNLLRIADDLKTSLKEEVRVQVSTLNGEKIYRLMVGGFPQRSGADALKRKVEQIYPDCFVVELK